VMCSQNEAEKKIVDYSDISDGEHGPKYEDNKNIAEEKGILDSLEEIADSFYTSCTDGTLFDIDRRNPQSNANNELNLKIKQMIEKHEGLWRCKVCGKTATHKGHIKQHAETHIEGMSHACHICRKTSPTRHGLRMHISEIHSELFSCDICEKSGMNRQALRNHKRRNHKSVAVKQ